MTRFGVVVLTALVALGCGGSSKCANAEACGAGGTGGAGGVSAAGASTEGGKTSAGSNTGGTNSSGGNSAGSNSAGSNSGGVTSSGGNGPVPACPPECLVAVTCVTQCGATPVSVGCCPCVAPAFDQHTCK